MESPPPRTTRGYQNICSGQSHSNLLRRRHPQQRTSIHRQAKPHPRSNPQTGMASQLAVLHPRPRGELQDVRGAVRKQHADSQAAQRGSL